MNSDGVAKRIPSPSRGRRGNGGIDLRPALGAFEPVATFVSKNAFVLLGMCFASTLVLPLPVHATTPRSLAQTASHSVSDVAEFGKLTVSDVKRMIDREEDVYIYDANGHDSYLVAHVPGAQWLQYNAVNTATLPKSRDAKIVFYCHNPLCGASPHAASVARSLGYRNVWLMPDGIVGWRAAGMPTVSGTSPK